MISFMVTTDKFLRYRRNQAKKLTHTILLGLIKNRVVSSAPHFYGIDATNAKKLTQTIFGRFDPPKVEKNPNVYVQIRSNSFP